MHHVGSLYILTYDARKLKHKITHTISKCFSERAPSQGDPKYKDLKILTVPTKAQLRHYVFRSKFAPTVRQYIAHKYLQNIPVTEHDSDSIISNRCL